MAKRKVTFIETAIPPHRGIAKHYENNENIAFVDFDRDGLVKSIHTPQDSFRRVHEVLHARHSNPNDYKGRQELVKNLIEDCRLHLTKWPWGHGETPQVILEDTNMIFKLEKKRRIEAKKEFDKIDPFSDFMQIFRENSVRKGMGTLTSRNRKSFTTRGQQGLADQLSHLILRGKHNEAAYMLEAAFFGEELKEAEERRKQEKMETPDSEEEGDERPDMEAVGNDDGDGEPVDDDALRRGLGYGNPQMDIVELPLVEDTHSMERGFRLTTSGSRIYRPALRRPVLPHRLFLKQSPIAPGGAILFDASGSMGVDQKMLLDCCRRTPAATVAFYSGEDGGNCGTLYVYAKEGRRATGNPEEFPDFDGGNGCDGMALDWLMKQEGPRIMVTDRNFTCNDYVVQIARLGMLEELGEVTVYHRYTEFFDDFPQVEPAA